MRFSAAFTLPLPPVRTAPPVEVVRPAETSLSRTAAPEPGWPRDLPDELDARVRLVGEWQLGEG